MATKNQTDWNGIPYYPISRYYKEFFGEKVLKLPVSVPGTCPNREGLNGMQVCNFCDEWGSAAYPESRDQELFDQIRHNKTQVLRKGKAKQFLVYFQSYTFTYSRVARLEKYMEACLDLGDICGFVIGTRPDCISDAVIDLWNRFAEKVPVFIELGVQSFDDSQLNWMSRGHDAQRSIKALLRLQKKCPTLNVGIHLMFGMPGETDHQIRETAELVNQLPIHNVKLHNLHVLKNTPLEQDFRAGLFIPIDFEKYCQRVGIFLQHLKPSLPIHRLAANSSRRDELVSPEWTGDKMRTYQQMLDYLIQNDIYQGQLYKEDEEQLKTSPTHLPLEFFSYQSQ